MKKETADKAAKWWADQLRGNAKLDNGDLSPTGGMTFFLASMLQKSEKENIDMSKIDMFQDALSEMIMEHNPWTITVDYNPDGFLEDAASSVELNLGMATLPWKTVMWVDGDKDTVKVSCGYGSPTVTL